jgi:hypothetical protein
VCSKITDTVRDEPSSVDAPRRSVDAEAIVVVATAAEV